MSFLKNEVNSGNFSLHRWMTQLLADCVIERIEKMFTSLPENADFGSYLKESVSQRGGSDVISFLNFSA